MKCYFALKAICFCKLDIKMRQNVCIPKYIFGNLIHLEIQVNAKLIGWFDAKGNAIK